jgi:UDP-glucose/iron transport system ATP-binding protein
VLRVDYLAVSGLPPVSFEVAPHECLAVEGPSGAGKTRLLRAIADLDAADGFVYLEGAERREVPAPEWRHRVRYASAEPAWWGARAREHFPAAAKLDRLILAVGLEPKLLDRPISELSTGERQRLGLVRAIVDEPRVLLLDEPTSALDAQAAALAEELIRSQMQAGRMVILVSHNPPQVVRLAHTRLVLPGNGRAAVVESVAA